MIFDVFKDFSELKYGLSEKGHGSMKLAMALAPEAANRVKYFRALGIQPSHLVIPIQSHSGVVQRVHKDDAARATPHADALVTPAKRLFLTVTVADCFPVYFYNPKTKAIGIAHCGWRGTVAGLAAKTLKAMRSEVAQTFVAIGPGIQSCHFEIQKDILPKFAGFPDAVEYRKKKIFINLPKIIKKQLVSAGVPGKNIELSKKCTADLKKKYFSFRRDKPGNLEAMIAYIGRI